MDTASPFRRTDIISMIPVYKAALTFHLKPFIRWTPTTTIKTSLKGATPKSVLELMNVKYLTLAHGKGHLQILKWWSITETRVWRIGLSNAGKRISANRKIKSISNPLHRKPSSLKTLSTLSRFLGNIKQNSGIRLEQHALGSSTDECPYNVMGFRIMSSKS